ncbi:hypothetical protein N7508_005069 [Penicillium antarcticum]|uniref:uncharacterized protein n=1 Tax=Penicillium antarcticum TaxID=416450 RepID=UPI0023A152F0|nr:uncharacterized protein N7508_005069 [Penicillium antarcticum]KAJ5306054.1 hypothetical protein N7508_005069 [Penicillium antarcticum]
MHQSHLISSSIPSARNTLQQAAAKDALFDECMEPHARSEAPRFVQLLNVGCDMRNALRVTSVQLGQRMGERYSLHYGSVEQVGFGYEVRNEI